MTGKEFKRTFMPLSNKLYSVAISLTCNTQEAEDTVQEAYMKLWIKRDSLPQMDNAEAYCVRLIKNICYDKMRTKCHTDDDNPPEALHVQAYTNIENEIEVRDYATIMLHCINALPYRQRILISMRDINGLDYDEIEQTTGLNMINIRVTLSRARKALRKQFNAIRNYGNKQD